MTFVLAPALLWGCSPDALVTLGDAPTVAADAGPASTDALVSEAQSSDAVFADFAGPDQELATQPDDVDTLVATDSADALGQDLEDKDEMDEQAEPDAQADGDAADATKADGEADGGEDCQNQAQCPVAKPCWQSICAQGQCQQVAKADGSPCEDGDACSSDDACVQGQCLGTIKDCTDANPCTEDSCASNLGCFHSNNAAPCNDNNACTVGDACSGGSCQAAAGLLDCDDGNECTSDTCLPVGGCIHQPTLGPCGLGQLCAAPGQCSQGACIQGNSTSCDDANPCTSDACNPSTGICQFVPTVGPCQDGKSCTIGDICANGVCKAGPAKVCADANPCSQDSCDEATGACQFFAVTGPCEDGSKCTLGDSCSQGVCLPGAVTTCDDGNPCTTDACVPASGCQYLPNQNKCLLDKVCELGQCQAGQCQGSGVAGCDDNNPCTQDWCVPGQGCVTSLLPDGSGCGDGDACSDNSTCNKGSCVAGTKTDCSDDNPCTDDGCSPQTGCQWVANTASCEDGSLCTTGDHCKSGKCLPGTAKDCSDANPCTDDVCSAKAGCSHKNNGSACDDYNACSSGDHCSGGACQGAVNAACNDGNPCTEDSCDSTTGLCVAKAQGGTCDDGNACTSGDSCVGGSCGAGSPKNCEDGNGCTVDSCEGKSGLCQHVPQSANVPCDDGNACTSGDHCTAGNCGGSAANGGCDDGNGCTTDACDAVTGLCTHVAKIGPCDDANPCTLGDTCDAKGSCNGGSQSPCDDGNPCTVDNCQVKSGACTHAPAPEGSACDDGLACTLSSACQGGLCTPTQEECTWYSEGFACDAGVKDWSVTAPAGYKVLWAVDQTPVTPDADKHGCTMNYNNGLNYCDQQVGIYCLLPPVLVAKSPTIDLTAKVAMPHLAFATYYALDGPLPGGTGFGTVDQDLPLVVLRDVDTNAVLDQFTLSKSTSACSGPCQSLWRSIDLDVPKVAGHRFRMEFSLQAPTNQGNQGKGWFIDDVAVTLQFGPEICGNNLDDNGNGKVDCADPACVGKGGCP